MTSTFSCQQPVDWMVLGSRTKVTLTPTGIPYTYLWLWSFILLSGIHAECEVQSRSLLCSCLYMVSANRHYLGKVWSGCTQRTGPRQLFTVQCCEDWCCKTHWPPLVVTCAASTVHGSTMSLLMLSPGCTLLWLSRLPVWIRRQASVPEWMTGGGGGG